MTDTYKSPNYNPEAVTASYVRFDGVAYPFCEVNIKGEDIRQGFLAIDRIPQAIKEEAQKLRGTWPSFVRLPKQLTLNQ